MPKFETARGYQPGIVGRVTELHAHYYSEHWNFDQFFETKIAIELAGFITDYDATQDCIWSTSVKGKIEGSITIDGSSEHNHIAHLRWFILSEQLRGTGAGNYLLRQAIEFCDTAKFGSIYLWTFKGLESARHLYEKYGFQLTEEQSGSQWGANVIEQRFELILRT